MSKNNLRESGNFEKLQQYANALYFISFKGL